MAMNKETPYLPLPDFLTVKKSKLHGLGLFATKNIEAETILGISHLYMVDMGFQDDLFRSPLGAFYNHSDEPNARTMKTPIEAGSLVFLIANKDINKGEEILVKYEMAPLPKEMIKK